MVDINLMGDEENREERRPDESFAPTVNLDLGETAEEEKAASFVTQSLPPNSYSRETMASGSYSTRPLSSMNANNTGSSRVKAYLLVAALIIAAVVAIWLMIPKAGKKADTVTDLGLPADSLAAIGTPADSGATDLNQPPVTEPTTEDESTSSLSSSLFSSTRIGAYTISALGQSFSGDNDFSVISFSGNNNSFLVQFTAPSAEAIAEVTQAMQRNASPEELSRKDGGSSNSAVVLGRVSDRAATMGSPGQRRMSFAELSAWLKSLASDNGLRLTLFEAGQAYANDGSTRTPVQANFTGNKAGAFAFLRSLADTGPNISTSKIIVSSADHKSQSSAQLDVVLLFDFIE
jgi:hypothetical protein